MRSSKECHAWPAGTQHAERFSAALADPAPVPPDRLVLHVLADHGIDIPTSCGEGVCSSCEIRVLSGQVEHRDALLSDAERAEYTVMMVCCSRARSPHLVPDI